MRFIAYPLRERDLRLPFLFAVLLVAVVVLAMTAGAAFADTESDQVQRWYAYVCGDDGAVFKFLAHYVMYPAFCLLVVCYAKNSKTLNAMPVVGVLIRVFGGAWAPWLRTAALKAAASSKNLSAILFAIFLLGALAACSSAQVQSSAQIVTDACGGGDAAAADAQAQLKGGALNTANSIIVYEKSVCGSAAAIAKAAADPTTAQWLASMTQQLKALVAAKGA